MQRIIYLDIRFINTVIYVYLQALYPTLHVNMHMFYMQSYIYIYKYVDMHYPQRYITFFILT